MPTSPENREWIEDRRLVHHELKRLNKKVESIDSRILEIHTDIVTLKVRAGLWGSMGGALIAIIVSLLIGRVEK